MNEELTVDDLNRKYEMCAQKMAECLEKDDEEGFERWLKISGDINREIDRLLRERKGE